MNWDAILYLERGHLFEGLGFGAEVCKGGEAVFNTGMTGYQEIFTDPSYCRQIVVMTYPHIGNTGVNSDDPESKRMDLSGVVTRQFCAEASSWRSRETLGQYLANGGIPIISDIDTRAVTQILRSEGAQRAVIFPKDLAKGKALSDFAQVALKDVPDMEGQELVSLVSTKDPYEFTLSEESRSDAGTFVVYDYGVKSNILRHLKRRRFKVMVVPYNYPYQDVLAFKPVGVVLSNGPGDPATVKGAVEEIQSVIGKVPVLAICMGHQLLARAVGAKTYKLKFGHHGINQPVKDITLNRILITSQNHGFAVRAEDIRGKDLVLSHVNLNDNTVEGFTSEKLRLYSVHVHPEAKPGPSDAAYIFDNFIRGFVK